MIDSPPVDHLKSMHVRHSSRHMMGEPEVVRVRGRLEVRSSRGLRLGLRLGVGLVLQLGLGLGLLLGLGSGLELGLEIGLGFRVRVRVKGYG